MGWPRQHFKGLGWPRQCFKGLGWHRQCFKGLGWPRRQCSFNLVNLGGLERVCRVGARREGVGDRHRFFLGFGCPREFWSSERARGVLPWYKLSRSRGGAHFSKNLTFAYMNIYTQRTYIHIYSFLNMKQVDILVANVDLASLGFGGASAMLHVCLASVKGFNKTPRRSSTLDPSTTLAPRTLDEPRPLGDPRPSALVPDPRPLGDPRHPHSR